MKDYDRIVKALEEHQSAVDFIVNSGCCWDMISEYIAQDNVKKKDLAHWLREYFIGWMNDLIDNDDITLEEAKIEILNFDSATS